MSKAAAGGNTFTALFNAAVERVRCALAGNFTMVAFWVTNGKVFISDPLKQADLDVSVKCSLRDLEGIVLFIRYCTDCIIRRGAAENTGFQIMKICTVISNLQIWAVGCFLVIGMNLCFLGAICFIEFIGITVQKPDFSLF